MAARFWVGGTGTWDASDTTHWASSSGGAGGQSVPGSSDTVTLDASSGGGTVTMGAAYNPTVTSITMGAFTGTLDLSANNNSPTMSTFSLTGTGTRTLNMGSGTWTITGSGTTVWSGGTLTNCTFTQTGVVEFTYSGGTGTRTCSHGSVAGGSESVALSFTVTAGTDLFASQAASRFKNVSYAGHAGNLSANSVTIYGNYTLGASQTINSGGTLTFAASSGTQTITTNGVTVNKAITINSTSTVSLADNLTMGTTNTLTLTEGTFNANDKTLSIGAFSSTNSNTRTLATGSGTWSITGTGTVWTTSTPTNLTTTGSATMKFTDSSSTDRTITLGTDTNLITISFWVSAGTGTVTITSSSTTLINSLNYTGFTGTATMTNSLVVGGDITFGAGMTVTDNANALQFADSATHTITTNSVDVKKKITLLSGSPVVNLADNYLSSTRDFLISNGTFNTNNYNVTVTTILSTNTNTRAISLGSSTVTLTGTGTVWSTATNTNLTFSAGTSTIKLTDTSSTAVTFSGGGLTYYTLWIARGSSTASNTIAGSNTFSTLKDDGTAAHSILFTAGTTQTVTTFNVNGTSGGLISLFSTSNGTAWNITTSSSQISCNYLSIRDSQATPATYVWFAGPQSENVSNNTGWFFSVPAVVAGVAPNVRTPAAVPNIGIASTIVNVRVMNYQTTRTGDRVNYQIGNPIGLLLALTYASTELLPYSDFRPNVRIR